MTTSESIEFDTMAAQALALRIAAFLESEMDAGADPALMAMAALGCGADLLRKTMTVETAVLALRRVADDLIELDAKPELKMH